jgi:hypothetical protein
LKFGLILMIWSPEQKQGRALLNSTPMKGPFLKLDSNTEVQNRLYSLNHMPKKIFISHSHTDREKAIQIYLALKKIGIEPWIDVTELKAGDGLLENISKAVNEVHYFAVLLSKSALTKSWVLTEMRMGLTHEIENGSPNIIPLLIEDCEIPNELSYKLYIDFRGRFDEAIIELQNQISGNKISPPIPIQSILSKMVREADAELWNRLYGSSKEWGQDEAANEIGSMRSDDLQAAVILAQGWKSGKWWE